MPNTPAHRRLRSMVTSNDLKEASVEHTGTIAGWDGFTPRVKQVLLMIPWTATEADACRHVGFDLYDWRKAKGKNPLIKNAVNQRRAFMASFIREASHELLSRSVFELSTMLDDPNIETKERLQVIDRIMKLTGFDKLPPPEPQQTQVNTFIRFAGSKSAPLEDEPIQLEVQNA
jgi:hypothetical protein